MSYILMNAEFKKTIDTYSIVEGKNLDYFGQFLFNPL
jgi:hypothetical protein